MSKSTPQKPDRILVVDDHRLVCEAIKAQLASEEQEVVMVFSGEEALDKLKKGIFQAVLLDIHLPNMSGYDLTKRVRRALPDLPIIGLSADEAEVQSDRWVKAGMSAMLSKRENTARLQTLLHQLISEQHRKAQEERKEEKKRQRALAKKLSPKKTSINLVIVDDLPIARYGIKGCLEEAVCQGHSLKIIGMAENGQHAIELILKTNPHIVILDYHLPDMTGFEVYQAITAQLPKIKVIFLTAAQDKETFQQLFQTEAVGFLTKQSTWFLPQAIELVLQKKCFIDPCLAVELFSQQEGFAQTPFLLNAKRRQTSSSSPLNW